MRHLHLCFVTILSAALFGDAAANPANATSSRLGNDDSSAILVLNMRTYWWELPEFRMAGDNAYAVVQVENTHNYTVKMHVSCRTPDGRIPGLSGQYTIPPRKFLRIDTRRNRTPLQKGEGVRVKCRFRADGHAKVQAWVYDNRS